MRQLYLIGFLLLSPMAQAQLLTDTQNLASDILSTLETTNAIKTLVTNKKTVVGQLKDIKTWTLNSRVDQDQYNELHQAYNQYAAIMNEIIDKLKIDLLSIESTRQLKKVKMNKLLTKFNNRYAEELNQAYAIYTRQFHPTLINVQQQVDAKSGIIPTIILVVKFGETLFNGIRDLFSKDELGRQARTDLIQTALSLTLDELTRSLHYPSWEEMVPGMSNSGFTTASAKKMSPSSMSFSNSSQSIAAKATIESSIALSYFGSDNPINLNQQGKNILVGGDLTEPSSLFVVNNPLKNGDRFWVKMQGFAYANFFYFDEITGEWQDPYGKSIVVGGELSPSASEATYLPGPKAYFEIGGDSKLEQFLILASTAPLDENVRSFLIGRSDSGEELLNALYTRFPYINATTEANTQANGQAISFNPRASNTGIVPVYIIIPKANSNSFTP